MIETSQELDKLAGALVKAQSAMKAAVKDSTNPHFKSKYADLASVWDACREPLTKNGLAVVQLPGFERLDEGSVATLTTMLLHESGQWIRETAKAPLTKADAQGVGSVLTYLRRYSLAAVASVAPEDDDGNAGSHRQETHERPADVDANGEIRDTPRAPAKPSGPVSLKSLVPFGKHKGKTVEAVGPDYFEFVANKMRTDENPHAPTKAFVDGALSAFFPEALVETEDDKAFAGRLGA
jgi:hypothetical protein